MNAADIGSGEALVQILLAVVVHEEADRATVHPIDRHAVVHETMQRLQHMPIAAERHDGVGLGRIAVAVAFRQARAGGDRLRHLARQEGNLVEFRLLFCHGSYGDGARRGRLAQVQENDKPVLIYSTFPSPEAAAAVGEELVAARLAACVNILPGMTSIYRWEGAIARDSEAVMIIKTRASLAVRVMETVKAGHSYANP